MEYVRRVDFAAIDRSGADERWNQPVIDHASANGHELLYQDTGRRRVAGRRFTLTRYFTPAGTMSISEGRQYDCLQLSHVSAEVPHRN
jgi:hypothetical protein